MLILSFNDLEWRTVDVPHDFSIEGEKVKSSSDAQAYLEGGLGYYRKRFTVPASMSGNKTISLDFEGVYQNSVVYLNGEKIGSYPSGYTGFALDITKKVKYGEENVLVVKVQNMSPSGRWYTGSGIIRPVHLVIDNRTFQPQRHHTDNSDSGGRLYGIQDRCTECRSNRLF